MGSNNRGADIYEMSDKPLTDTPKQWLTLKAASAFLGVHFTTLRTWADKGEIRVMRTPGGHRRFSMADLRRFLDERASHAIITNEDSLMAAAVRHVQQEIAKNEETPGKWHYKLDDTATTVRQARGRKLFALAISFVLKPKQREHILDEGRKLGTEYGAEAAKNAVSLVETGRAVQFFRHQLFHAVHDIDGLEPLDADDVRIHQALNHFLDEVLYAVLDGYEQTLMASA